MSRISTTFVAEELFEVMQKNASKRWIFVAKSLPVCFLCSAYLLKLKKLKRTTLFFLKVRCFLMFSVYNVDNQTFNNRFQFLLSAIFPISLVSRISDDGFCLFIDFQIEFCQCCCRSYNLYSISLVRKVPDSIVQIHHTVAIGFLLT